jgi:kinetochore protein Spc7/SPC105
MEKQHGWNISGVTGNTISMTYRREIELVFDITSFQSGDGIRQPSGNSTNSRIDLWYIAANREHDPQPLTPEKEFFIQSIRDYVRRLDQPSTKISTLLRAVGAGWTRAGAVANDIRLLTCTFPTKITRTDDSSIGVKVALLLAPLETKLELVLELHAQPKLEEGLRFTILPQAKVVYGEPFKIDNVSEFLATRLGDSILSKEDRADRESWSDVVVELYERLLAKGRK